jgi:hypothetical protein
MPFRSFTRLGAAVVTALAALLALVAPAAAQTPPPPTPEAAAAIDPGAAFRPLTVRTTVGGVATAGVSVTASYRLPGRVDTTTTVAVRSTATAGGAAAAFTAVKVGEVIVTGVGPGSTRGSLRITVPYGSTPFVVTLPLQAGAARPFASIEGASVVEGNRGTTNAAVTVRLDAATSAPWSFELVPQFDSTATKPDTNLPTALRGTIPAGQRSTTVTVPVVGDTLVESTEVLILSLAPSDASWPLGIAYAGITIVDDDANATRPLVVRTLVDGVPTAGVPVEVSYRTAATQEPIELPRVTSVNTPNGPTATFPSAPIGPVLTVAAPEPYAALTTVTIPAGTGPFTFTLEATNAVVQYGLASIDDLDVREGDTGLTTADVTVRLSAPFAGTWPFELAVRAGTATPSSDLKLPATIRGAIPAGKTSVTVPIPVIGDRTVEPDETFTVELRPTDAMWPVEDGEATVTIVNDDKAPTRALTIVTSVNGKPTAGINVRVSYEVPGRDDPVNFGVRVSAATPTGPSVTYPAVPTGTRLLATALAPGKEHWSADIVVPEGPGAFTINANLVPVPGPVTPARIDDLTITEGDTGLTTANVTVRLGLAVRAPWTFELKVRPGTATLRNDLRLPVSIRGVIPAGRSSVTVPIPVVGDRVVEADETALITLVPITPSSRPGEDEWPVADAEAVLTIADDDTPTVSIGNGRVTEPKVNPEKRPVATITLSKPSTSWVTAQVGMEAGTATKADYSEQLVGVRFAPGETKKTVNLDILPDGYKEPDETFTVVLWALTGARYGDRRGTVTIAANG